MVSQLLRLQPPQLLVQSFSFRLLQQIQSPSPSLVQQRLEAPSQQFLVHGLASLVSSRPTSGYLQAFQFKLASSQSRLALTHMLRTSSSSVVPVIQTAYTLV